ncbi:LAFE_0E05710g1_1 [Lachancea fermentati]|uniref:LAFE_0E05710g1_1 n=1 Tax=Lachancea fermentati TaxID=4955 RepID=A0A1G4MD13_LACFM|nr:LAFE_0E05710g1_1 [Lachancea fermentati]
MEASNLQIYWHESQPIYSLCFHQSNSTARHTRRLVTAGGDNKIRIWQLNFDQDNKDKVDTIDFLSSLTQHEQAVNVVRFDSNNETLATAGDDGQLLLWRKNDKIVKEFGTDEEEFADFKESWYIWKRLRTSSMGASSEIYDLCWSPDDKFIVTGSMDNSVRIFDVEQSKCIVVSTEHNHYVQGVTWDPNDEFIISQSADRSIHVHKIQRDNNGLITSLKIANKITKGDLPTREGMNSKVLKHKSLKTSYLFHNETLPSFFRRLCMSPCGNLLCIPTGIFRINDSGSENMTDELANAVYIFTRFSLKNNSNRPVLCLPFLHKPALAISFNPRLYKLNGNDKPYIDLPYKLVFAVATSDEVLLYDTESTEPIAVIGNLHYTPITDLSWSADGCMLMLSSTDGFCSYVSMKQGTLGGLYEKDLPKRASESEHSALESSASVDNSSNQKRKAPSDNSLTETAEKISKTSGIQCASSASEVGQKKEFEVATKPVSSNEAKSTPKKSVKRRIQPTLMS